MVKTLQEQIQESRKVFEENKEFYSQNPSLLLGKESSMILPEETFIGLLSNGATGLEFRGTVVIGGEELHEYHAKYHGKEIVMMADKKIYDL